MFHRCPPLCADRRCHPILVVVKCRAEAEIAAPACRGRAGDGSGSGGGRDTGGWARPSGDPLDPLGHHAGDAAGSPGPDHRRDRAAHDRPRPGRYRAPALGGHRLSADLDRGHPALWQDRRHLRPTDRDDDRRRHLPGRLGALCRRAQHDRADPGARPPGHRRRRADLAGPDHPGRCGRAPRARPLQAYFAAVFATASIAGPVLGGYFADTCTGR